MTFTKEEMLNAENAILAKLKNCPDGKCARCQMMSMCCADPEFASIWQITITRAILYGPAKALSILYVNAVLLGAAMAEARMMD